MKELALRGFAARTQVSFPVIYKGTLIGDYLADLLVEDRLVVELKCAEQLSKEHMAQCINYLKASRLKLAAGQFQHPKVEWKWIVYGL